MRVVCWINWTLYNLFHYISCPIVCIGTAGTSLAQKSNGIWPVAMASSVPELMAEARAEQALIAAQLRALKGTEGSEAFSPYSPATASLRSAPGSPRNGLGNHRDMSPGLEGSVMGSPVGGEELSALRAHVAELDHELVQRDCAIEELQGKLKQVSEALENLGFFSEHSEVRESYFFPLLQAQHFSLIEGSFMKSFSIILLPSS